MRYKYAVVISIFLAYTASANITTPWSESFDSLSEQNINNPTFPPFAGGTEGQCSGGQYSQITTSASRGGNGKGIRWWVGNSKNDNSGTFAFKLANPTNEIWVRMYKRYASGFSWQGGGPNDEKVLWFVDSSQTQPIIYEHSRTACYDAVRGNVSDAIYFWMQGNSVNQEPCGQPNTGWVATQGGNTGDGQWHVYEVHIKKDTNGSNGILRVWVDGLLKMNETSLNMGDGWPRDILHFQINQDSGANVGCAPVDIDDIEVYTTTPLEIDAQGNAFIGPVGWTSDPVDGVCGSADGESFSETPTTNLCSAGTDVTVSGDGPWTWACNGTNGGSNAFCSATLLSSVINWLTSGGIVVTDPVTGNAIGTPQ